VTSHRVMHCLHACMHRTQQEIMTVSGPDCMARFEVHAHSSSIPGDLLVYGGDSLLPDNGGIVSRRSAAANVCGVRTSCHQGTCETSAC
jgi:hypothetical protein